MFTPRPEQSHPGDLCGGDSDPKNKKPKGKITLKGFEISNLSPHCQPWV